MITYQYIGRRGRLGNQMFQYATLFAIAKENNYEFGIPFKTRNSDEYMDMCLGDCFLNLSSKDSSNHIPTKQIQEIQNIFTPEFLKISDGVDIYGYFQTEKYFKKYRSELLKEFQFKNEIAEKVKLIKNKIGNKCISLHMRYGDYEMFPNVYPRPTENYYKTALTKMPDLPIILFSDNINKASDYLKSIGVEHTASSGLNKYEDMCLMSLCDYHIIANSSFSWWGSWLSNSLLTVAPKQWYGNDPNAPKYWGDVYCEGWEIL